MSFDNGRDEYPIFQVWRPASAGSTIYNKIDEIQLQSDDQVTRSGGSRIENIILTDNNMIAVQSGDVVGYYHPPDARYRVRTIQNDGYIQYQFSGSHESDESVDLSNKDNDNNRQPLIQFTIDKSVA